MIAETASGRVAGRRRNGVVEFLGIPYAAPPTGEHRFRPPRPAAPWAGVRAATSPGAWAPQGPSGPRSISADAGITQSEDCLTLNVWTPDSDAGRRPVVVWLHGGGFIEGGGAAAQYRPLELVRRGDIVFVSCNYRLGLLGFAAHDAFRDNEAGAAGNWGLLDQLAVLEWIQTNVAAFGGDPTRVTLAGHSAGAMSVCDLLAAPAARGLFRRAIAMSGGPSARSLKESTETVEWVISQLGLSEPRQLRSVPVDDLLRAQQRLAARGQAFATRPAVDGALLADHPLDIAIRGDTAPAPLLIGTTRDEVRFFYAGSPILARLSEVALRSRLAAAVGRERTDAVIDAYRGGREAGVSPGDLFVAIECDRTLRAPAMRLAACQAEKVSRTYAYRFDLASTDPERGACHALDLPLLFSSAPVRHLRRWIEWTDATRALARRMQDSWIRFVRDGSPVQREPPDWPPYDDGRRRTFLLDTPCTVDASTGGELRVWLDSEIRF